jgi:hypothetical protein
MEQASFQPSLPDLENSETILEGTAGKKNPLRMGNRGPGMQWVTADPQHSDVCVFPYLPGPSLKFHQSVLLSILSSHLSSSLALCSLTLYLWPLVSD